MCAEVTLPGNQLRRLLATVDHYKKQWQRSNEVAAEYRAKAEKLAEIHRQIHDTLKERILEAMKHEF